jgi:hypothetical protein
MTFCSNFGQMGPCCRHDIEDVVAVCVGFSRHLPDFPKCNMYGVMIITLIALSSCPLLVLYCAALSSSNRAGWLLRRLSSCRPLVFSSRRTLVLLSSSHCDAVSLSHRAIWLLRCPSSRRRLVLSSSSHSQRHSQRPRRWRSLSPAAPDVELCRRGGPRHCITVALSIALDAVSCPPTLSL